MTFVVPFATPVDLPTGQFTYKVYDPDFFIAYDYIKGETVTAIGNLPKGCAIHVGAVAFDESIEQTKHATRRQTRRLAAGPAAGFRLTVCTTCFSFLQAGSKLTARGKTLFRILLVLLALAAACLPGGQAAHAGLGRPCHAGPGRHGRDPDGKAGTASVAAPQKCKRHGSGAEPSPPIRWNGSRQNSAPFTAGCPHL